MLQWPKWKVKIKIHLHHNVMSSSPEHTCASFRKRPSVGADSALRKIFSLCKIFGAPEIKQGNGCYIWKVLWGIQKRLCEPEPRLAEGVICCWAPWCCSSREMRGALWVSGLLCWHFCTLAPYAQVGGMISTYLETGGIDPTCQTFVKSYFVEDDHYNSVTITL